MKNVLTQIQKNTKLSDNEQQIVTYILEHLEEIPNISSRELARRCYTTATSIMRLIKKLGYENYNDFKYNLVSSLKNTPLDNLQISSNENALVLLNKVAKLEVDTIQKTKEMIEIDILGRLVNDLKNVTYIDIICSDTNKEVARYASHYLMTTGKIIAVYYDSDKQFHLSLSAPSDHFIIVVTKSALSSQYEQYLQMMHQRGLKIALMTGNKNNRLSSLCDYTLYTPFNDEEMLEEDGSIQMRNMVFHTAIKYLFDVLYSLLYSLETEQSHRKMMVYKDIFM